MHVSRLLFVGSVDEAHKLVCQAPGCGRAISKAVHVIRDETGAVRVVGSGCYVKLSGYEAATQAGPAFTGFGGRRLTPEERALMVADTEAFVARVEARLTAEMEKARQAAEREQAVAQRTREQQAPVVHTFARHSHGQWRAAVPDGPEVMRPSERTRALDELARYRAQQARQAARTAMQRRPELSAFSVEAVAEAMVQAKAQYLGRGFRMDAPDARSAIEAAAVTILEKRGAQRRGS